MDKTVGFEVISLEVVTIEIVILEKLLEGSFNKNS